MNTMKGMEKDSGFSSCLLLRVTLRVLSEQKVRENIPHHLSKLTRRESVGLRRYFGAKPKHLLPHFYFLPFLLSTKGKEGKLHRLRLGLGLTGSSLPKNGNNKPACGTLLLENFTSFSFFQQVSRSFPK